MKMLLFFFLSFTASAQEFSFVIQGQYGSEWYKVNKKKEDWICQTRHVPHFKAHAYPLEGLDWAALKKESGAVKKDCQKKVVVTDSLGTGPEKTAMGCLGQPAFQKLFRLLRKNCQTLL